MRAAFDGRMQNGWAEGDETRFCKLVAPLAWPPQRLKGVKGRGGGGLVASLDSRLQLVVRGAGLARVEGSLRPFWSLLPRDRLHLFIIPSRKPTIDALCETRNVGRNVADVDQEKESRADRTIHEIIVVEKGWMECRQPNQ